MKAGIVHLIFDLALLGWTFESLYYTSSEPKVLPPEVDVTENCNRMVRFGIDLINVIVWDRSITIL